MKLGQRLTALRNKKHLTQDQLAEILGVKRARYNAWENSISNPDYDNLTQLAAYHQVSVDYLLGLVQPGVSVTSGRSDPLGLNGQNSTAPSSRDFDKSALSSREERDIAADLEKMLSDLESNEALAFHGEGEDAESKELLRNSLKNSLILAKQLAKKKFSPVKSHK